jgi:hypothetical protein
MILNVFAQISIVSLLISTQTAQFGSSFVVGKSASEVVLASHEMSLEKRYYPVQKENILLNLAYMEGRVSSKQDINWNDIQKPQSYAFSLKPGETFAFHDDVLPEYTNVTKTTNAHFNSSEGFKSAGYLVGDGVCHLASLMYWTSIDAGLKTEAPTNHNFMAIPEIDRQYGVSIYSNPYIKGNGRQNLYITNTKENTVEFKFDYDGDILKVSVIEMN